MVTLALEGDVDAVRDAGLIEDGYTAEFDNDSAPYTSTIVFLVRKGNPKQVAGWQDLCREDITVLNRRVGSSARIALDLKLKELGLSPARLPGYDRIMSSHLTMAAAIAAGDADLALGTERISRQIDGIDFIPLMQERFDLVIKKEMLEAEPVRKLLGILNSPVFRREVAHFSGNDYRDLGKIIMEV